MPSSTRRRPRALAEQLLSEAGQGEITAEEQAAAAEASFHPVPRALLVPIERIAPSRDNPRKSFGRLDDLADSIAERGVLQPLVVRRDPDRPGYYITVAGARRLLAARIVQGSDDADARARAAALPCVVMDETDRDAFADALAENLAREDLSRAEVMEALLRLQDEYGWSARYIARRTGRGVGDVAELLGIAKDDEIAPLVRDELITPTTAGQIRRLHKDLRPSAIEGVRAGRVKTVEDVRRLRRQERDRPISDTSTATHSPSDRPISDSSTTTHLPSDRPISDIGTSIIPANGRAAPDTQAGDHAQEEAQTAPAKASDIGRDTPAQAAPAVPDQMAEDETSRGHRAVAAAAHAVVQAIGRLVSLDGPLDSATLASMRRARDDLSAYIARRENA